MTAPAASRTAGEELPPAAAVAMARLGHCLAYREAADRARLLAARAVADGTLSDLDARALVYAEDDMAAAVEALARIEAA